MGDLIDSETGEVVTDTAMVPTAVQTEVLANKALKQYQDFFSADQARFLVELTRRPVEDRLAALAAQIPIAVVRQWRAEDADFDLACSEASETALDQIENSVYNQILVQGDGRLGLEVLKIRRKEKFNPSESDEEGATGHIFRDFNGQPLHSAEGEEDDD